MVLKLFMFLTVWRLWLLTYLSGESICKNSNVGNINTTTELQFDVLLPCYFEPVLLGSNKTADIAAVWIQENETITNLLEISLQGEVRFWINKQGRIKTFPKVQESGNFSILLHNVQQSDVGLYRCELFKGFNCSIAYQEIGLHTGSHAQNFLVQNWPFIAGGGTIALLALVVSLCCLPHTCGNKSNTSLYANTGFEQNRDVNMDADLQSVRGSNTIENPAYGMVIQQNSNSYATEKEDTFENPLYESAGQSKSNNCATEEEGTSPDNPVYATVKKGKKI